MNLDQLRSTLTEHADTLEDSPAARIAPVHRRVAVVRRRRVGALAGAAVVAVVAAGLAVVPPVLRDHGLQVAGHDAPSTLAGRTVPRSQVATGFTYRYVRGYQSAPGAGSLDVSVPVSDKPRLVMWASSDTSGRPVVRLRDRADSDSTQVSGAGGFGRYSVLPANDRGTRTDRFRLTQRGAGPHTRLALAVYDVTDLSKAGVGDGNVVFRNQVAGESLVKAVVGKPGESDLRFRMRIPTTDLSWSPTCYGGTHWYSVSVDGHDLMGSQCDRQPNLDAGAGGAVFDGNPFWNGVRAGDTVQVRIHLSPSAKNSRAVAEDRGAVLGIGVYTHSAPRHRVLGMDLGDQSESGGHAWLADRWVYSSAGERSLRLKLTASRRPRLLTYVAAGVADGRSRVDFKVSPQGGGRARIVEQNESAAGGPSSGSGYVVQPGESPDVVVEVPHGSTSRTRLALVVSDPLE